MFSPSYCFVHSCYNIILFDLDNAPFEINISSRKRKGIQQVMEKQSGVLMIKSILKLLESAMEDIKSLLTGSAMRFDPDSMGTKSRMASYSSSSAGDEVVVHDL